MTLALQARKLALTAHVTSSVGWLGAVASSLALAVTALATDDPQRVRAAYLLLEALGWYVLIPLSVASLSTGAISALGSRWGLFRHYWVILKLAINVFATVVLIMYMGTLEGLSDAAAQASDDEVLGLSTWSPVVHAGTALGLLAAATILGIYKPRGLTRYGWRKQQERRAGLAPP